MKVCVPGHALLLVCVVWDLGRACTLDGITMICQEVPSAFSAGYLSLVMILKDVGEINSTAFRSGNLASVTRLTINGANVTSMAAGALGSFRQLQNLTLDQNGLARVDPAWLDRPAALKALSLAENRIEVLDGSTFGGLTGLTLLNLAKNRIRAVHAGSFILQSSLAHLDLSGNRLTRVDPEVLRPLGSASIRLDGNPWNCSCGVEDFVVFLKDLQRRSLLERAMEVTCGSPSSLLGQPVWNTAATCGSSTTPPSAPETTLRPNGNSTPPSAPETTLQPTPTEMFTLQLKPTGKSITVPTLIGVIVALCVLLCVTCFLGVLYRRKRKRKSVKPGPLSEEDKENDDQDGDGASAKHPKTPADPERTDDPTWWNSEIAWRTPITGARAKSASAVLLTSPTCTTVKDHLDAAAKTEGPLENTETTAEVNAKLGRESDEVGIRQEENAEFTNEAMQNCEKDDTGVVRWEDVDKAIPCVSDAVPYFSIGTDPSKPNVDPARGQHDSAAGLQCQMGKVMPRVSTWPPTSAQWQARCSTTEQQEGLGITATVPLPNLPPQAELRGQAEHLNDVEFEGDTVQVVCTRDAIPGDTSSQSSGVCALESSCSSEIIPETVAEDARVSDVVSAAPDQSTAPPETNELPRERRPSRPRTVTPDTECPQEMAAVEDVRSKLSDKDLNPPGSPDLSPPRSLSGEVQSDEGQDKSQTSLNEDEELDSGAAEVTLEGGAAEITEGFANHDTCESDRGVLVNEQEQVQMELGSSRQTDQGSFSSTAPSGGGVSPGDDSLLVVDNEHAYIDLLHEVAHNHGRWTRQRWKQTHLNKQRYKHQGGIWRP